MSFVSHLRCTACGSHFDAGMLMNLCPHDQRPVEMIFDLERLSMERPGHSWYHPERRDMWRFGGLLALDIDTPGDQRHIVSLGEGATPLLEYSDQPSARTGGIELLIKDEGRGHGGWGANPSQSFKDRGMAMTVSMARRFGLERLALPTQGNAGDSLCTYVEPTQMHCVVAMPDDTPLPIRGRVAALALESDQFHLVQVKGTIREAGEALKRDWIPDGWFNLATFQEPGWRTDGKKTLGLELAEPRAAGDPWSVPDVVVYPTGGGTGVLGMWKAWSELECLGLIDERRPRMICVQSTRTPPLVTAWEAGATDSTPASPGTTLAYGLNVPGGVGHFRVLEIISESAGGAISVSEDAMSQALTAVWKDKGWWIGPEGAACLAALPEILDRGFAHPGERVVVVNTGSLEKYLPDLRHLL